jgi:hypothetical protein
LQRSRRDARPPSKISPHEGTELSIGIFQLSSGNFSGEQQADVLLINTSSYTCSTTSPNPDSLPDSRIVIGQR